MFVPLSPEKWENEKQKRTGNCTKVAYTIKDNVRYLLMIYKLGLNGTIGLPVIDKDFHGC